MNTNLIAASHGFNIMGLGLSQGKPLHREGAVQRERATASQLQVKPYGRT